MILYGNSQKEDMAHNSALIIVDMQNGFMNDHTRPLVTKIAALLKKKLFPSVFFSKFINTDTSPFVRQLTWNKLMQPPETDIVPELTPYAAQTYNKPGLTALTAELKAELQNHAVQTLILAGIETDSCILKTALDAFEQQYTVYILADYCASKLGPQRHEDALSVIGKNIGYHHIVTLRDYLKTAERTI